MRSDTSGDREGFADSNNQVGILWVCGLSIALVSLLVAELLMYVWLLTLPWFAVTAVLGYVSSTWIRRPWIAGLTTLLATVIGLWLSFTLTIFLLRDGLLVGDLWDMAALSMTGVMFWSPFIVLLSIARGLASFRARRGALRLPDPNS